MSISFVFMLLAAAPQNDPLDAARIVYSNCLIDVVNEHLDKDESENSFDTAAKTACESEKAAYRAMIVNTERAMGSNASAAQQYADEEIAMVVNSWSANYNDLKSDKSRPVKE